MKFVVIDKDESGVVHTEGTHYRGPSPIDAESPEEAAVYAFDGKRDVDRDAIEVTEVVPGLVWDVTGISPRRNARTKEIRDLGETCRWGAAVVKIDGIFIPLDQPKIDNEEDKNENS